MSPTSYVVPRHLAGEAERARGRPGPGASQAEGGRWLARLAVGIVIAAAVTAWSMPTAAQVYVQPAGGIVLGGGVSGGTHAVFTMLPAGIAGDVSGSHRVPGGIMALGVGGASLSLVSPPATLTLGQGATISANAQIPFDSPVVTLFYRKGGARSFASLPMTLTAGTTYQTTIPGTSVTERGVEYYVRSNVGPLGLLQPRSDADLSPGPIPVDLVDFSANGALTTTSGAYRMMSFAAALASGTPEAIFVDDLGAQSKQAWRLGRWNPAPAETTYNEYTPDTPLALGPIVAGNAYWLITDGARTVDFSGASQPRPSAGVFPITLKPGWNQIANPFAFDVLLDSIDVVVEGAHYSPQEAFARSWLEQNPLHECQDCNAGQYVTSSRTLAPWRGYFVANLRSSGDIVLNVPYLEAGSALAPMQRAAPSGPRWSLAVTARDEAGRESAVEVGLADGASPGMDELDALASPQPPGERLELASVSESLPAAVSRLGRDFHPWQQDGGSTWKLLVKSAARGTIRVRTSALGELPAGTRVELIDPEARRHVDLLHADYELLAIGSDEQARLVLAIGSDGFVGGTAAQLAPPDLEFGLRPIAPNPVSGTVFVQFALARDGDARVEVLDVSGRRVEMLASGSRAAGLHTVRWEGRAASGGRVGAGVYYVRLEAGGQQQTRKFVLLR